MLAVTHREEPGVISHLPFLTWTSTFGLSGCGVLLCLSHLSPWCDDSALGQAPNPWNPEFCLWPCHLGDASGTIYKSAVAWVGPHELWQIIVWHKRRSVWVRALCQCLNKLFLVTVDALGKWCLGFYLLYFSDSLLLSVTPKLHVRCQ